MACSWALHPRGVGTHGARFRLAASPSAPAGERRKHAHCARRRASPPRRPLVVASEPELREPAEEITDPGTLLEATEALGALRREGAGRVVIARLRESGQLHSPPNDGPINASWST